MAKHDQITLRELAWHAFVVTAIVVLLLPGTVLRGEVAIAADLLFEVPPWNAHVPADYEPVRNETTLESVTQFSAWYFATQEALQDGEWPLWNPYPFLGVPLLANYQSAVLYPLHILNAWVDIPVAMTIYLIVKLWLCGLFAFICARCLGLSLFPAQFASLGWMLGGYVQVWCYWAEVDVVAWLPLLLLSAEFLATGLHRRGFFLMSLSATLMLIAGHPETALVVSSGVACYFFIRLAQLRRHLGRVCVLASMAWAFALAINAAQILPFLEYLRHSHTFSYRAVEESVDYFVPTHGALAILAPKFFGFTADNNYWGERNSNFVHIVYVGVPVLFGIVALLVRGRPSVLGRRAVALAPPAILSMLLAFDIPVLARLHDLPVLSSAWEIHALSFAAFGLPLLGAMGIESWFSRDRRPGQLLPAIALAGFIGVSLGLAYSMYEGAFPNDLFRTYEHHQLTIAIALSIGSLMLLARHVFGGGPRFAMAGFTVLLVADLLIAGAGMRPTTPRAHVFPPTPVTAYLQALHDPPRIAATPTDAAGNTYPNFGIEQLYGYDGIFPARIKRFMNELAPIGAAWSQAEPLLAISRYLYPADMLDLEAMADAYRPDLRVDGVDVLTNLKALPRVRLVGHVARFDSGDAVIDHLKTVTFDTKRTVLIEADKSVAFPSSTSDALGDARIVDRTTQTMTVQINAAEPCMLVAAEAYYPGWRATIDGEPVEIFPAYHVLRAVPVPAGEHEVRFEYAPRSFWIGYSVSLAGMVAGLLAGLAGWRRLRAGEPLQPE